jgi:hypothetical protein
MTIDRSFIENWKASTPDAFQTQPPADADVAFIDGQLKLITPESMVDWADWVNIYQRMIARYLAMPKMHTVILAFDDSTNSPYAKSATQAKRRSRSTPMEWSELQPLPAMIPPNQNLLLNNRVFKMKSIKYIIEQVSLYCKTGPNQRVIVDYMGLPYVCAGVGSGRQGTHTGDNGAGEGATQFETACELGECDVKIARYTGLGNVLIFDAVDGDFVQIAMSTIEKLGESCPNIYVKRLLLQPSNAAMAASGTPQQSAKKKSKKDAFTVPGISDKENIEPGATAPVVKKSREYEFCHANKVVDTMRKTFAKNTPDSLKPFVVRMLSFLVSMCGCDFTRGVSWCNGSTVFLHHELLWPGLCKATSIAPDQSTVVMCPRLVAEGVIGVLWKQVQFKKFCQSVVMRNASFEMLHQELATNTAISLFRRERLVTPTQLRCLVASSNWVQMYWSQPIACPCSLTGGDFGFTRATEKGPVIFDDKKPLPPLSKTVAKKASAKADEGWPP